MACASRRHGRDIGRAADDQRLLSAGGDSGTRIGRDGSPGHIFKRSTPGGGFMRTFVAILIGLFMATAGSAQEVSAVRGKALRECNAAADKFKQRIWGTWELHQYRTCMKRQEQKE